MRNSRKACFYPWNTIRSITRRKRRRKTIWFNPSYSLNVKTNIGKIFLNLLHKHFSPTHFFHKTFNKNTVKISYSCMRNMNSIISAHNLVILNPPKTKYGCNFRDNANCPLQSQCFTTHCLPSRCLQQFRKLI